MTLATNPPDALAPAQPPRRWGFKAKLVLLCGTLLFLVLLDVAAARVYRLVTGHPWPAGNPARAYRIPVDPYHHGLLPNFSTDGAQWGGNYPFRTNSLGFKDAKVRDVPLVPSGKRIVVIGDSFTEGVGVPYEETFTGKLGAALAPEGVEVLNAGCQSYTPVIHYRKIKFLLDDVGLKFDELIVAIDQSDAQNEGDYELVDDVVRPRLFRDRIAEVLKTNSIVLWTLLDAALGQRGFTELHNAGRGGVTAGEAAKLGSDAEIEAALRKLACIGFPVGAWPHDEKLYREFGERGIKSMTAYMDRLLALLKTKGIPLTVVVYPWPDQIVAGETDCKHERFWRDWCAKNGVRFADAFPKFEIGCPWRRRAEILDAYYVPGDTHFNAEGHRLVAEAILETRK